MKDNFEDMTDDELYASYEAYKALLDAGLTKAQALDRTGLTAQIVKDFEEEEDEMGYDEEATEEWDRGGKDEDFDFDDDSDWKEENVDDEWGDDYEDDSGGGGSWDDSY